MTLSSLFKLLTATIIVFLTLAVGIGTWGWKELERPYQISQDFHHYQSRFNTDVKLLLQRYLATGNADQLQAAESIILDLEAKQFDWLEASENKKISDSFSTLEEQIVLVRSAGKLANNPQTLLIHNERERLADITGLRLYSDKGQAYPLAIRHEFNSLLLELNQSLGQIILLRQQYFTQANDKILKNIIDNNHQFSDLVTRLEALPRFNIYTEIDEDELDPDPPEEIGEIAINSLASLTRRYEKELNNTIELSGKNNDSRLGLNLAMEETALLLNSYQSNVDDIKTAITNRVKWAMTVSVGIVISILALLFSMQNKLISYLSSLEVFLKRLVQGHYKQSLSSPLNYKELQSLEQSSQQLQDYFATLIDQLDQQAQQVVTASSEMQSISNTAHRLTTKQKEATDEVASSVTVLSHSFKDVAEGASNASMATNTANQATITANQQLDNASQSVQKLAQDLITVEDVMSRLEVAGANINEVVGVIQSIAEQTNLLALNAAIEAARAGNHGRGFAVVADEVRELASRTTESTEKISDIIQGLVNTSLEAAETVRIQRAAAVMCSDQMIETQEAIRPVVSAIGKLNQINTAIDVSTKDQVGTVNNIALSTDNIKEHSTLVSQNMNEIKTAGDVLVNVSDALNNLVKQLKH